MLVDGILSMTRRREYSYINPVQYQSIGFAPLEILIHFKSIDHWTRLTQIILDIRQII